MNNKFEDIDYWKGIILFGLNTATYKIVLGKTLLQLALEGRHIIDWSTLSRTYLDNYIARSEIISAPQLSHPTRRAIIQRIVMDLQQNKMTYNEAVEKVGLEGFGDVIPRFHNLGGNVSEFKEKFYHYEFGKKLYLHDSVFNVNENYEEELIQELESRWSLLEGAFKIKQDSWELDNDLRLTYIIKGYDRQKLTENIPFLSAYQGNICFYCAESFGSSDFHVDHVLPRQVVMHDEIWNLVLSHGICNLHKEDSLVGPHYIEKLIARNENILGSNHPWKYKISQILGYNRETRKKMTLSHYENVKKILHNRFWESNPKYNRATDPFFKKLITFLNNR